MKAILASNDITKVSGGIELIEQMVGKHRNQINVAVINEGAAVEFGSHRWAIENLHNLANKVGGSVEIVHLLALSSEKIRDRMMMADIIFILGGNTEWMKTVFDKSGFTEMMPELIKTKVFVGSSAGGMILGRRLSSETQDKIYGQEEYFGVDSYLNLLNLAVLPHCFGNVANNVKDIVLSESKSVNYPIYAISDTAAVAVNGKDISVVGDNFMKVFNGKIV